MREISRNENVACGRRNKGCLVYFRRTVPFISCNDKPMGKSCLFLEFRKCLNEFNMLLFRRLHAAGIYDVGLFYCKRLYVYDRFIISDVFFRIKKSVIYAAVNDFNPAALYSAFKKVFLYEIAWNNNAVCILQTPLYLPFLPGTLGILKDCTYNVIYYDHGGKLEFRRNHPGAGSIDYGVIFLPSGKGIYLEPVVKKFRKKIVLNIYAGKLQGIFLCICIAVHFRTEKFKSDFTTAFKDFNQGMKIGTKPAPSVIAAESINTHVHETDYIIHRHLFKVPGKPGNKQDFLLIETYLRALYNSPMSEFEELGIGNSLEEKLHELNITSPTAVQKQVIPLISQGKNVMFQSETGTGKTFAYLLPLIQGILEKDPDSKDVSILIASPTYELASQIKIEVQKLCSLKCALCIGGTPISRQVELLKEKPRIVIGGSTRLLELIHLKKLKANAVKALVLDETDRLLSPELREDTMGLMERLPSRVQIIGNSATVSDFTRKTLEKLRGLAVSRQESQAPEEIEPVMFVALPPEDVLRKRIEHWALFAERREKIDTLRSLINALSFTKMIVFTSKGDQVDIIAAKLKFRKIDCEGLSRKTDKKMRKTIIDRFRSGKLKVLITTDLTSRGLDIPEISHVVQLDITESDDFFIHRAGRTARAGSTGTNIVIGDEFDLKRYAALEKKLNFIVHPKELYKGKVQDIHLQDYE